MFKEVILMDKEMSIGSIIMIFVFIIIGVAFLTSIADTTQPITNALPITNESFTGVQNTAVSLAHGNLTAVSAVKFSNGTTVPTSNYTVNLTPGTITLVTANGTYYTDYNYHADTYVADGASRTLVNTNIIFYAAFILIILAGITKAMYDKYS